MPDTKNFLLLALSVPFLYLLIGLDTWYSRRRLGKARSLAAFLENVRMSMGQQVINAPLQLLIGLVYVLVYERFALFRIPVSAGAYAIAFVMIDFNTYWFHRFSHRTQLLWANHSVHHSGQEFGLAVSVRHPWFGGILLAMPQFLLAVAGVPPLVLFPVVTVFYLFQFLTHSESIRSLGPLEHLLVTPSHHRVHHGRNAEYLDRNYGAVLILWDKLFGTFVAERAEPEYGLVHPTGIRNVAWENLYQYVYTWRGVRALPTLRKKISFLFSPPDAACAMLVAEGGGDLLDRTIREESRMLRLERVQRPALVYATFVLSFALTVLYMAAHHQLTAVVAIPWGAMIFALILVQSSDAGRAEMAVAPARAPEGPGLRRALPVRASRRAKGA